MILTKSNFHNFDFDNKIVIFPTDTVYGIGCKYRDIESVKRIYDIKNRDYSKPMAILCYSLEQVKKIVDKEVNIDKSLTKYWPGKLTLIFRKNPEISDIITANKTTVGVRIPNNAIALNILKKHGPMVVTSLNESNEPAITQFNEALGYKDQVDYVIDGGDLSNKPSTVYDTINKKVLRQGDIKIGE